MLSELQSAPKEFKLQQDKQEVKRVEYDADLARRHSLMSNPNMRYVYSRKDLVFHDKLCPKIKAISNHDFQMVPNFKKEETWCRECYRKALIRAGISQDAKRLSAYETFFERAGASIRNLFELFIENEAKISWVNTNMVQLKVHEDTWRVTCNTDGVELLHNNYIYLGNDSRLFTDGFHRQSTYGNDTFAGITKIMTSYSWEEHQKRKEAKAAAEMAKQNADKQMLKPMHQSSSIKSILLHFVSGSASEKEDALFRLEKIFNKNQMKQIKKGAKKLSLGQIAVYAAPELNEKQMRELRSSLQWHISKKQVRTYANASYSHWKMKWCKIKFLLKKTPMDYWYMILYLIRKETHDN